MNQANSPTPDPLPDTITSLQSAYRQNPADAGPAVKLAQHYMDQGWLNQAAEIFDKLSGGSDPALCTDYGMLLAWGNLCCKRQELPKALRMFKKTTVLRPRGAEGWNNLGIAYLMSGENENAKGCFEKVLELEPDNAGALLNLGNFYQQKGEVDRALRLFEKSVAVRPDFADGWFNLGNAWCARADYIKAQKAYHKALRYQREFPSALKNLGFALEQSGQYDQAEQHYRKALEFNKADPSLYVNIANACLKLNKFDDAKKYYSSAVKLAPTDVSGWLGLRSLALFKGDLLTYVKATLAIIHRLPPPEIAGAVRTLHELGKYGMVDEILEKADAMQIRGDELDGARLVAYQRRQSDAGKIVALQKRLSESAANGAVRLWLAEFYCKSGLFQKTVECFKKGAADGGYGIKLLWKALFALGKLEEVDCSIQNYLQQNPDFFDGWFFKAKLLLLRDNPQEAQNALSTAVEYGFSDVELIKEEPMLRKLYQKITTGT
ncbi:MAG: tetratricopeptide repeat protein [Chitinivibrionales bacterium]|nr:tetratricopeptide repeat protein [Chitinivibrionales bacterium]